MQKFYQVFQIYFLCNEEEKAQIIFCIFFTFSAHFKDITLQLQKLMTKAKQTYKCEVKTFIRRSVR